LYEEHANMSFIPSDQPLRWLVGKQHMISRKQVSVGAQPCVDASERLAYWRDSSCRHR
jgi:hypothetical protein